MLNNKLNLNINKDDPSINDYLFCAADFDGIPNKISIYSTYKIKEFVEFVNKISISKSLSKEIIPTGEDSIINEKSLVKINDGIYLSFVEYDKTSELGVITDISIYYKSSEFEKESNDLIESLSPFIVDYQDGVEQKFNILTLTPDGLQLEPIDPIDFDYDNIDLYYNSSVMKKSKRLTKSIKNAKKGLSIIYGERGSGKTTLITHIASNIDKLCIFVPANMIDVTINSNEFKNIIKRYRNSILVIDDCEIFFSHAYTKSNIFTNNLLQMVDGVSSDMDSLHIVTILNTPDEHEIDPTLLECNNLIDVIEVDRLEKSTVDEICKYLGQKNKFHNPRIIEVLKNKKTKDKSTEMGF